MMMNDVAHRKALSGAFQLSELGSVARRVLGATRHANPLTKKEA